MKTILRIGFVVILLCLFAIPVQAQIEKHEALASKLVNQCANVEEGDYVLITGSTRDADLMHEIFLQTRKVGAFPLIALQSQQRSRRHYDIVPEKFDSNVDKFNLDLTNLITTQISISITEEYGLFKDVSSVRMATRAESFQNANDIFRERNVRLVSLGNGLYPTDGLAQQFGITKIQLADLFWSGVNTDYDKLAEIGTSIKSILDNGKKIHITTKSGTNLKMMINSRSVIVSDGIISDEEKEKGSPACLVWLPAGEVYFTPVPGTAEGKVVVESFFSQGKEIKDLTLIFKGGKLISMSAQSGLESYKEYYDAAGAGKEEFAYVDLGINPDVKIIPGSNMKAYMIFGMITIGHGDNVWAGGNNSSSYGTAYYLPNATLKLDRKVVVKNGVLK